MEYRILGPLSVRAGGQELHLGGHKQRRMLALLLLRPNRPVEIGELAAVGWDDDVPHAGRRQVQNAIAALRAVLTRAGGIIDTVDGGYLLRVGPDELDVLVFERMVRHARTVTDFRAALDLWRGPALAGLAGGALAEEARPLDESRLAALEDRLDLELAAGQHESLVDELQHLVAAHPLRERLVGQLMLALHRCGRATEAAAAYEELSARLAEELGIDPGTEIRRVQASLDTSGRQAAPRPAQLPADVSVFTGRISDLTRLDALLAAGESAGAVVVAAIVGTAGLGKSALAVHWAHRVRERFPDGQLHVNLRGYAPTAPVRPLDALARFLRALGVAPDAIPTELDAAVTLYRSILTGKRVLVVLDNAATADQIRPLLPANPASVALVTSRDQLSELVDSDGAHRLTLDRLTADEAVELLARILGAERLGADDRGAERLGADDRGAERLGADDHGAELARLCAYLPLALRIAAANLADQPSLAVADYVAKLRGGDRLTALQIEGDPRAAVRATIDLSYAARPEPVRRLLRLLALAPGPDVTPESAAP
ncbi:MAG: hypothetical protein QOI74_296, partial [Micromonosporaceae bacterium]|nr:hypothetical protein [Micromonosporaceae bacterium]